MGVGPSCQGYPQGGSVGASGLEAEALLRYPPAKWSGWGCSLSWLGKALGCCREAESWADLLFSTRDVPVQSLWPNWAGAYMPPAVPGLGLSIARYNVGGCGRPEEQTGHPYGGSKVRGWFALIEGFQPMAGGEFDWSRDEGQRNFLHLAVERGVDQVELFANAPMWWMSNSGSSFGGSLAQPDEFASYLGEVASQACSGWGVPVRSVAPFNEPSADWWMFPHDQEGCKVSAAQQARVIARLRDELDQRGLSDVVIAASDENRPDQAIRTWQELGRADVAGGPSGSYVGCLNVHAYDGLEPWLESRHRGYRSALRRLATLARVPLCVSEHGNGDSNGVTLAQVILEDFHYLQPASWCYWQPVEHHSSWGLVEADFGDTPSQEPRAADLPHPKYFIFAHFTRFIRRGMIMLHCSEPWAAASFAPEENSLAAVISNPSSVLSRQRLRLPAFVPKGRGSERRRVQAVLTEPQRRRLFVPCEVEVQEAAGCLELLVEVPPRAICSVLLPNVSLIAGKSSVQESTMGVDSPAQAGKLRKHSHDADIGVTVQMISSMARAAAEGAALERWLGQADLQTMRCWSRWEHECGCAATALDAIPPAMPQNESGFNDLMEAVCAAAWGAEVTVKGPKAKVAKAMTMLKVLVAFKEAASPEAGSPDSGIGPGLITPSVGFVIGLPVAFAETAEMMKMAVSSAPDGSESQAKAPEALEAPTPQHREPESVGPGKTELEHFSQLPIRKRTVPAEQWEKEVLKPHRRFVTFSYIPLHCSRQTKDNIIIGVLFYNSCSEKSQKSQNREEFVKWRLTDLAQPEPRNITVHLRWQACLHWRKREHVAEASRGSMMAILNPQLIEAANKIGTSEARLLVENPKQIEKLGVCPILGSCKKKGCNLPCNSSLNETYCRQHLDLANKSKCEATAGREDETQLLGLKRHASESLAEAKVAKTEDARSAGKEVDSVDAAAETKAKMAKEQLGRAKEEQQKRLELALLLDERRFHTAEANKSYQKFVRKGMKKEDVAMSRVPQLGRGFDSSGCLEVVVSMDEMRTEDILFVSPRDFEVQSLLPRRCSLNGAVDYGLQAANGEDYRPLANLVEHIGEQFKLIVL
ncbi:unnamed protein product, partial [Durusdinium trenchii]